MNKNSEFYKNYAMLNVYSLRKDQERNKLLRLYYYDDLERIDDTPMPMNKSSYIIRSPEKSRTMGYPYVPTFGAAAGAVDQYCAVGMLSNAFIEARTAFTDTTAVASLAKIAEGGIFDIKEIEAAETGLQALLLHDVVYVLVPALKIASSNNLVSYFRNDEGKRTAFGFKLFSIAQSKDFLVAGEFVEVENGQIINSTLHKSDLIGQSLKDLHSRPYWNKAAAEAINVTVEMHKIPAYLTDPELIIPRAGDGFPKHFYHHLNISWKTATKGLPPIVCTFDLPPLLTMVLNRLNKRENLLQEISALREELRPVRRELHDFNQIISRATSSADIERQTKRIEESFDAIIPETRMSSAEKRCRGIARFWKLGKPLLSFAAGFAMKNGAELKDMGDILYAKDSLVQRTVTARTFKDLLNTEGLQSLVKYHFCDSEISAIEKSIRMRRSQ